MSNATIRRLDNLGFQYYDRDNNNSFDVYEVGFVQNPNGSTTHFTLTDRISNFYALDVAAESPTSNDSYLQHTGKSMFYVANTGFMFRNLQDDGLNAIVYSAHPYGDPSAYGVLSYYQSGEIIFPHPFTDAMPLAVKTENHKASSPTLSQQMKSVFADESFLKTLGFKSVDALYQKYNILTEGEVIFSQNSEIKLQHLHDLIGNEPAFAVTYNRTTKPLIIFDDLYLESIFGNGTPSLQRLNDLRSALLHEVDHAEHEDFKTGIVNPNSFNDPRLQAWFSKVHNPQQMMRDETTLLSDNNFLYTKYYKYYYGGPANKDGAASVRAVFVQALVESRAYAKQLREMYKTGTANHSAEFVATVLKSAILHFDLTLSLTRVNESKEYVKEILAPIIGNEALIADLQAKANELDRELKKDHFAKRLEAFLTDQPLPMH